MLNALYVAYFLTKKKIRTKRRFFCCFILLAFYLFMYLFILIFRIVISVV